MKVTILMSFLAATGCFFVATPVNAGEWNQKTTFTFNEPVEIPGHVLEPGKYEFKVGVGNTSDDRNVVEVYNKNEDHLYGMFLTVPDYRLKRAAKPIIEFEERPAGSPEAIWAWFYPGDKYGHEFVYPKSEALRLAQANNRPVASMPDEAIGGAVDAMKQARVTAVTPKGEEVEVITVFGTPADR